MKKILRTSFKILLWLLGTVVFLVVLVLILIQVPAVQQFAKNKVVAFLEKKLKTKVAIGRLDINFPKRIVLEKIYFEDQRKDTLLAGDTIRVDISMLRLLRSEVELSYLELNGITANIYRLKPDTVFNFDYIIKAFAGEQKKEPADTSASTMKFKLGDIVLKRIRGTFHDDVTGNDARFALGNFHTEITTFDPDKFIFSIPEISLDHVDAQVRQYKPLVIINPLPESVADTAASQPITLKLDKIALQQIKAGYTNEVNALAASLDLGRMNVVTESLDLEKLWMRLRQFELNDSRIVVHMGKTTPVVKGEQTLQQPGEDDTTMAVPWRLELKDLGLVNNSIQYDDDNSPALKKGMDYGHILINQLTVDAGDILASSEGYKADVRQVAMQEKSGFVLKQLKANIDYNAKQAVIKGLVMKTNASEIHNELTATYPSTEAFTKNPGAVTLDLDLNNTHIAVADVVTLVPALEPQLKNFRNNVLHVTANAKGAVNNITIGNFEASGLGKTAVQVSGRVQGMPDVEKGYYDLKLARFTTTAADINGIVPRKAMPDNIRIPESMALRGNFKGTTKDFNAALEGKTTRGGINVVAVMKGNGKWYDVKAALDKIDVGYLAKQEKNVGKVTLTASAKGSGFDYKKMNTIARLKVVEANVKGYTYRNLLLNADVANGVVKANSEMRDPNIEFSLQATANVIPQYPEVQLMLRLDTLDLNALHIVKDTLQMHGVVSADFTNTNPDSLAGKLAIFDLNVLQNTQRYRPDTVAVNARQEGGDQIIELRSEMADVTLQGQYKLTEVATAVQHTINRYYRLPGFKDTAFTAQNWTLDMHLRPSTPLVLQMMPALRGTDSIAGNVAFNSTENKLNIDLQAPKLQYGTWVVNGINVNSATEETLRYNISAQGARNGNLQLFQPTVRGFVDSSQLNATVSLKDGAGKDYYKLGANVAQIADGIEASLIPDSLILNRDKWQVAADNFIQYDSGGVLVNNFTISNNNQSLSVNSTEKTVNAPVQVKFENFRIKTLTDFVASDSLDVDGIIEGNAVAKNITTNPVFTSDITVKNLTWNKDTVGNILVKVDNETANAFNADVRIEGHGNDVQLKGMYYTGESRMDLKLDINNLALSSIKPFSMGQLQDASGSLKGNVSMSGTLQQPQINGNLRFEEAKITPMMTGEPLLLKNETIAISNKGVSFSRFTLADSAGNKATVTGGIYTNNLKDFRFETNLRARNFRVVNAPQGTDRLFYGKLNIDTDIQLRGTPEAPSVNGNLKVNKETNFVFVLPTTDPELEDRKGVVQFVDKDHPVDTLVTASVLDSLSDQTPLKGMDVNMDIATDSAAVFTMVIDERNGDALTIKGRADLAGGIDESGKLNLTGSYELGEGSYQLSLSVLKRKFDIQRGSTIIWTGDPTSAQVDITAAYYTNTPPIDLVASQLSNREQTEMNRFKEKLPFQVLLKMKGELLKPEISFDIVLPDAELSQWPEVDAKLQQMRNDPSELNKQVFAVLLLNRFVQEDPLQSDAGSTTAAQMAKQSASKILTDQLNRLTGSLIKGVDLTFDLNSDQDYTTGTEQDRTELNVGVSKKLLNDRLRVNVGSNFELEGPANANRETSNIAGDLSVDYQLSKDGRYMLRAYRKNQYEAVVEGQVVETGLSFILTYDYNQFKELFTGRKERREQRKRIRRINNNMDDRNRNNNNNKKNNNTSNSGGGNNSGPQQ
ncbi:hypothetical protein HNQ91_005027 [Filimonas zeae]|uniref:translocation/assembly module TamB domain-containing protein n=1 Tax=Filimonas zeae TaxID=1737353 RepID=UPI0016682AC8|nr:translocation/assembly module TamB domain-containing protein [Filimonas zeae]MDR6341950.1 hypothetical protein [Filimonas zeae]